MSKLAWLYIGAVLVIAAAASASALSALPGIPIPSITVAMLVVLATLSQFFKAEAPGNVAFFATPVFVFAGVLLLDPSLFVLLVLIPRLSEWARERWTNRAGGHLRAWYIQPFNIANDIINGLAAGAVYRAFSGPGTSAPVHLFAISAAVLTYLVLNHLVLGQGLVLARKLTWRETGLFSGESVISDLVLLCLGACVAMLWLANPWLLPLALSPLGIMYRALRIPQLKREAETDTKTGLLNARHFNRRFAEELDRAARFGRPLAVIMADLDLLRDINNTYGHLAGDAVIIGIGQIIHRTIRKYDLAGRFGGEEFCIVLPEMTPVGAYELADRIRSTIEAAAFEVATSDAPIRATMSLGVACYPVDGKTVTELTHQADVAVYQAKLQGRNRVVSAADVPQSLDIQHAAPPANLAAAPAPAPGAAGPGRAAGGISTGYATAARNAAAPGTMGAVAPALARTGAPRGNPLSGAGNLREQGRTSAGPAEATTSTAARPAAAEKLRRGLQLFVGGIICAGALLTLLGFGLDPGLDYAAVATLIALVVIAELLQVDVYGRNAMSVAMAPIFASALVGGVPAVACVSAASALVDHFRHKRRWDTLYKTAFNWATHLIAGALPAIAISTRLVSIDSARILPLAILTAVSILAYYLIETLLISTAIGLSKATGIAATWSAQFRWLANQYLVLGLMGLFLSIAYAMLGIAGLVVFMLPVIMMRYTQAQYIERTEDSVRELQRMNTELSQANVEVLIANQAIEQLNGKLQLLNDELFLTLGKILDARDPYVGGHAAQVAYYAAVIAAELGLPPARVELVHQAGFLHDVGKIAIPERILHKPAKLSEDEYEQIKQHAVIGAALLETSKGLSHLSPFVRHHHERWDGRGYPDGLKAEEIPLEARILNLCDSVEAMASDRPYHLGMSPREIIAEVRRCAGQQFDPVIAEVFIRVAEREVDSFIVNSAWGVAERAVPAPGRARAEPARVGVQPLQA